MSHNLVTYKHTINGTEHTLVFNPDAKGSQPRYTIDGKRATGVTTILGMIAKPQLVDWAVRLNAREAVLKSVEVAYSGAERLGKVYPQKLIDILSKSETLSSSQAKKLAAEFPEWVDITTAHTKKSDTAKDTGTLAHANVEEYIRWKMGEYESFAINPEVAHIVQPFIDWAEGRVKVTPQEARTTYNRNVVEIVPKTIKFIRCEQSVFSVKRMSAGTLDFVVEIDGEKYLGDFKTSTGIYGREYFYQTAAYHSFCDEMGWGKDIIGSVIVRSGKEGNDLEVKVSRTFDEDLACFDAAYILYKNGFTDVRVDACYTEEPTKTK